MIRPEGERRTPLQMAESAGYVAAAALLSAALKKPVKNDTKGDVDIRATLMEMFENAPGMQADIAGMPHSLLVELNHALSVDIFD
jgi:hypothetical protein